MRNPDTPVMLDRQDQRRFHLPALLAACAGTAAFLLVLPVLDMASRTAKPAYTVRTIETVAPSPPPPRPPESRTEERPFEPPSQPPLIALPAPYLPKTELDWSLPPVVLDPNALSPSRFDSFPVVFPAHPGYHELADLDAPLRPLLQNHPAYPYRARTRGIEGSVTLEYLVNEEGRVEHADVLDAVPPGYFEESALRAARHWRFQPGTRAGKPVRVRIRQTLTFTLEE